MRPYAFIERGNTGCCPGHDWPRCYRWAGRYSSPSSRRSDTKSNALAKRIRRRGEKMKQWNSHEWD